MTRPQSSSNSARLSGKHQPSRLLLGAVATSAVASVCCLGPLLLLTLGISGAWMSRLMIVESWYPLLATLSLSLIALAAWQLMQPRACGHLKEARSLRLPEAGQMAALIIAVLLSLLFLSSEYWLLWLV